MRLTSYRLGRRRSESLLGKDGREEAEKGDGESGGFHLGQLLCKRIEGKENENAGEEKKNAREWNL